jgi:hypothetical protein
MLSRALPRHILYGKHFSMKRILCLVLLIAGTMQNTRACDVCGCSASNQYLGILPQFYRHFVGVQYQYRSFNSSHPPLFAGRPDERSTEYYNTIQLWGRYYVGKRLQLFGFVPYQNNIRNSATGKIITSGIGDASMLANVVIVKADTTPKTWKHMLLAGGGIKLPTGKYSGITALDRAGLPNMQAGTGSWDFVVNANYTVRYKMAGLNLDAAYTLTTVNREKYKYGNRLNTGFLAFYWLQAGAFNILPQAGMRYEYTLHDYDNYERKWLNEQSGGYQCFTSAGVQVYYKRFGLQSMYQIPVSQHYAAGYVAAKKRLETGLLFLF